jgi:anti-sigma B factor antagonist
MIFEFTKKDQITVVKPKDKHLNAAVARQFKDELVQQVGKAQTCLVLDLSEVDFIDSSGLAAIVSAFKMAVPAKKFVICEIKQPVQSLFQLTRVNAVIPIYRSLAAALAAAKE